MNKFEHFASLLPRLIGSQEGSVSPAIVNSASFSYGNAQNAQNIFAGSVKKPVYSRMGNPTNTKLEAVLTKMDNGTGATATSSGMAAINLAILGMTQSGDEIISIGGLFSGTYTMFTETYIRYGIKTHFFDVEELENIKNAINKNTKVIFCESVGNPNMRLPDLKAIANIANEYGVCFVVDNTTTPISIAPLDIGADMSVYSTTKIITGNSSALGGAVVFKEVKDGDKFHSEKYKFLHKIIKKAGKDALVMNAKKRVLRDFGFSANAFASYMTLLGLETLPIRAARVAKNIEIFAKILDENGFSVRHPSLPNHEHNELYKKEFEYGCGTLLTVDMGTKEDAYKLLDNLKLTFMTANIGDSRTLALHTDSTIYADIDIESKKTLGITPGLIRISFGLENPQTIADDFIQARDS